MIATFGLAAVMMMGVSTANAKGGLLMSDLAGGDNQPCTEQKGDTKTDWGIIMADFTGVVVHGFTGVVVHGFTGIIISDAADTPVECGIIIHG